MSLLFVGLAIALLAAALSGRDQQRAAWLALVVTYGLPAAFIVLTLTAASESAIRYRFSLLGFGFRAPAGEELRVAIGGDREKHDLWVSALDTGTLRNATESTDDAHDEGSLLGWLVLRPEGTEGPRLGFMPGETPAQRGLLGLRRLGQPIRPVRSLELQDGDRIRVGDKSFDLEINGSELVFTSEDKKYSVPGRRASLPLGVKVPVRRPLPAAAETVPLAWLTGDDGLIRAEPLAFFFWETRGFSRRLFLHAPAESAVMVERDGQPLAWPGGVALENAAIHVLSPPRWDGLSHRAGGVRDRRSYRLEIGEESLVAKLETPEVYVLSRKALAELAADADGTDLAATEAQSPDDPLRVHLTLGGWQLSDRSISFRHASQPVASEALATLTLPPRVATGDTGLAGFWRKLTAAPDRFTLSMPQGQRVLRSGEAFWLGRDRLASVRVDVLRPPLPLGLLALALALLKVVAARAGHITGRHLLLAAPLEALLALRLLVGYRVWVMPPFSQEAFELALLAWGALPWAYLLVAVPVAGDRLELSSAFPTWAGGVLAAGWCLAFGDGLRGLVFAGVVVGAGMIGLARAGLFERLADAFEEYFAQHREERLEISERRILFLWLAAASLPTLLRAGFLVLGYRESFQWAGQRFALTLLHLPLALVLQAAYLLWLERRAHDEGELRWPDLLPGIALVGGVWLVPSLIVNDLGLALLNVPVFLIAWSLLAWRSRPRSGIDAWRSAQRWTAAAPAVMLGLYLVFVAFPVGARMLIALIPEQTALDLESERNYLRLLAFAYPDQLEEVARRGSEELAVMSAVMRSYTSGPLAGRGYFGSEVSPHIAATALREHAPAVFVASEWGLAGSLGMMLLLLVATAAGIGLLASDPDRGRETDLGTVTAALAALTLGIASLYMLLANYRLTLFTGKNVYLLGLDSTADVLEVVLLAVLFSLGAALARDQEETW